MTLWFCNPGATHFKKCIVLVSGSTTGVQTRLNLHAHSALYIHCPCHLLQQAAVNAVEEDADIKVLGTLVSILLFTLEMGKTKRDSVLASASTSQDAKAYSDSR